MEAQARFVPARELRGIERDEKIAPTPTHGGSGAAIFRS
jgi:hypothetical protein